MTKRDFFRLLIKIFGLYWFISTIFIAVPENLSYITSTGISSVIWSLFSIAVILLIFYGCMVKADGLIDWLQLDKGFDEDRIDMINFNPSVIIKLAAIIIGGFLIIDSIPNFLMHVLYALEEDSSGFALRPEGNIYWAIHGMKLIIGFLLIKNHSKLEHWLSRNQRTH